MSSLPSQQSLSDRHFAISSKSKVSPPPSNIPVPFKALIAPLTFRLFSKSFHQALSDIFDVDLQSLYEASAYTNPREIQSTLHAIITLIERELFDAHHFVTIQCGFDSSLSHPQSLSTGTNGMCSLPSDPLSTLMFPDLNYSVLFPSAPMPVKDVPLWDITAIGQRYQAVLEEVRKSYGAHEERHFKEHFFPQCQGEPVFELGYALDAKAHITSTIVEHVTKQRLLLCVPPSSEMWKYFNYSFLRSFGVAILHSAMSFKKESDASLTLQDVSSHIRLMRHRFEMRQSMCEGSLLDAIAGSAANPSFSESLRDTWAVDALEGTVRECCKAIVSSHLAFAQLLFLEELAESVPNVAELMRLLGSQKEQLLSKCSPLRVSTNVERLTPSIYLV